MMIDQEIELRGGFSSPTAVPSVDHRYTAACGSTKRRSSSSSQEPFSKKPNLLGFTKIPLPIVSPIESPKSPEISTIHVPTPSPASESAACSSSSDGTDSLSPRIGPKVTDSINEHRNNSTRLNRMKQIIREMSQWCDEFIDEDEEQEEDHKNPKDEFENKTEESVSVDRTGDGFMINFNCSCGKDYQILLSNTKIYYKL